MKVLFSVGHPGHVHLFKNLIWALQKKGHECKILASDKDVSISLLNAYSLDYTLAGNSKTSSFLLKVFGQLKTEHSLYKVAKKLKPDILVGGPGGLSVSHIGKILKIPSIVFDDTEHSKLEHYLMDPFATLICTPSCYKRDLGNKQVRYNGYHELAYLHPNYFTPNPYVLHELGLNENEPYVVMRFVSWGAAHDIGHQGLTLEDKRKAVYELEKYGPVLISSENCLPDDLEKYKISVTPDKIHNFLYYASLLYGESATMASECAVLGTHAIFCDYAGRGYTDEQEQKYDLVYNFYDETTMGQRSLNKAIKLLENPNLKMEGKNKCKILLSDKIDVTKFMVNLVEDILNK